MLLCVHFLFLKKPGQTWVCVLHDSAQFRPSEINGFMIDHITTLSGRDPGSCSTWLFRMDKPFTCIHLCMQASSFSHHFGLAFSSSAEYAIKNPFFSPSIGKDRARMPTDRHARQGATKLRIFLVCMGMLLCEAQQATWTTKTLAGDGTSGLKDGTGGQAQFKLPNDVAISMDDSTIMYIADRGNGKIRKYDSSLDSVESLPVVLPGNCPTSIALSNKVTLVVASACNHSVCTVNLETGSIDLMVGGDGAGYQDGSRSMSKFSGPR
jgi:hypothetical protein